MTVQLTTADHDAVVNLVRDTARDIIVPRFNRVGHEHKADGSLVTEADLLTQRMLTEGLARRFPDIPLLGEEMSPEEQQHRLSEGEGGLWILDPLDGTGNFVSGIPFFAVSLALVVAGRVELGVVYHPAADECFSALRGAGARLNDRPLRAESTLELGAASGLVDFKRLSAPLASRLATAPPYRSQRSFGSVALDWCWVAAGRCQVYLHGSQKVWDLAAGSLILEEAGGRAATLDGEAVFAPVLGGRSAVAATTPGLYTAWRQWLDAER